MHRFNLQGQFPCLNISLGLWNCSYSSPHSLPQDPNLLHVWNLEKKVNNSCFPNFPAIESESIATINQAGEIVYISKKEHLERCFYNPLTTMIHKADLLAEKELYQRVPAPAYNFELKEKTKLKNNLLNTAESWLAEGNDEQALDTFETALKNTKQAKDYKRVCDFFLEKGTGEEKKLSSLYLAILYYQEENFEEAEKALIFAQKLRQSVSTTELLGDYYFYQNKKEKSASFYQIAAEKTRCNKKKALLWRKTLTCNPDNVEAYKKLAETCERTNIKFWVYLLAFTHFYKKNEPDQATTFKELAKKANSSEDPILEIIHLCLAQKVESDNHELRWVLCRNTANLLTRKDHHDHAERYYFSACESKEDKDFEALLLCLEFSHEHVREIKTKNAINKWIELCGEQTKIYKKALESLPKSEEFRLRYILYLLKQENLESQNELLDQVKWITKNQLESPVNNKFDINHHITDHPDNTFMRELIMKNHELFKSFFHESDLRNFYELWIENLQKSGEREETLDSLKHAIKNYQDRYLFRLSAIRYIFSNKIKEEVPFLIEQIKWLNIKKDEEKIKHPISFLFKEIFTSIQNEKLNAFNINLITENSELFQNVFLEYDYKELFQSLFKQYITQEQYVEAMEIARLGFELFPQHIDFRREVFTFTFEQRENKHVQEYYNDIVNNCKAIAIQCDQPEVQTFLEQLYEICIDLSLAQELAKIYVQQNHFDKAAQIYLTTAQDAALQTNNEQLESCIQAIDDIDVNNCQFTNKQLKSYMILKNLVAKDRELKAVKNQVEENSARILNIIDSLPQPGIVSQWISRVRELLTWSWKKEEVN